MTAPLLFLNSLIVTPALVGPIPQATPLKMSQGASFAGTWAWVDQGAGVNLSGTTASATFRQLPTDAPILTVTSSLTSSGQITYLAPVPNFPYLPPSLDNEGLSPTIITIYPFQVLVTLAGVALVTVQYLQWSFNVTWPDATVTQLMSGEVFVSSV